MKKHRLQFDLTPEALQALDELKEQAAAATRAEVIRKALRMYSWFLKQRESGTALMLKRGDAISQIEFLPW